MSIYQKSILAHGTAKVEKGKGMYKKASEWCYKAKTEMQRQGISQVELAKAIGRTRQSVSKVLNGTMICQPAVNDISAYLKISNEY